MSIVWQVSPSKLADEIEAYGRRIERAIAAVGEFIAPKIEAYAKQTAPWTDRTSQARQGLTATSEAAESLVVVYLYHQADYGKWLEIAHGGAWRVIVPALTAHYGEIMSLLRRVLAEAA